MSYRRSRNEQRKLKKVYEETKNRYGPGVWYDSAKKRYKRITFSKSGYTKFLRRMANKKVRKRKECCNGAQYKREFDYKWNLY